MIGIYKITNPSDKVYIGQSMNIKRRWNHYTNTSLSKGQIKMYNSIKKYGRENHIFEIIEECSLDQLNERETFYKQQFINEYGWSRALFCGLYDAGGGPKSKETIYKLKQHKRTDDVKKKISKALIGIKRSIITKEKFSLYAKNRSYEHNLKISQKLKGHKQTPQHCLNKSKAMKGKKVRCKNVLQYDLQGNFIKEWSAAKEACSFYNPKDLNGVSACCLGRQKTAFGYIWKYKEN